MLPIHQIEAGGQFRLAVRSGRGVTQNRAESTTFGKRARIRGRQNRGNGHKDKENDTAMQEKRQFELRGSDRVQADPARRYS